MSHKHTKEVRTFLAEEAASLKRKLTLDEGDIMQAAVIGEAICPRRIYVELRDEVKAILTKHRVPLSNPPGLPKR